MKTKIIAIVLIAAIAISLVGIVATVSARPFMGWRNHNGRQGILDGIGATQSHVRINGLINDWGGDSVTGSIHTQSRTIVVNDSDVRQGSSATAIWTANETRAISSVRSRENFTYTFYSARLVDPDVTSLNVNGYSYFLNGTWNVFNVTTTFTIYTDSTGNITGVNRNQNAVPLETEAYGELTVTSDGSTSTFVLSIGDLAELSGTVYRERFMTRLCNPFQIGEDDTSTTVTQTDIADIKAAYGACPGWGNYNQVMDYNFNYRVDVCDLATAAANLNA